MAQPYDNINSSMVTILPGGFIKNYAYKSDTKQLEYFGWAVKGSSNSSNVWTIEKKVYNVNNQVSTERLAHSVAWDNRESISYD